MKKSNWIFFGIILVIIAVATLYDSPKDVIEDVKGVKKNSYAGSQTCKSCHKQEFAAWENSHHDWAMREVTEENVLGDFENSTYSADGVQYTFTKSDKKYEVEIAELDGGVQKYEIAYTFGYHPLQQYLVEFPDGQFQTLRVSWNSEKNEWFHQYEDQKIHPSDWLHWTRGGQRWNTMCADCHSTNLKKNYNLQSRSFNTTYDEINVSCESCHGPQSLHAQTGEMIEGKMNSGKSQMEQINACGPCHARRVKLGNTMNPLEDFSNQFLLQNISTQYYHGDGQVREEDYVLGSFVQSKMFHNDVKCTDCHNAHTLELKFEGNLLCGQCHEESYNSPEHHFHQVETASSQCINCHMTGNNFMGIDFRRDHSFRVPRPDQSVVFGTPNACTKCHEDQSDEWAANAVKEWYGPEREKNYSDHLLSASSGELSEEKLNELLTFINDQKEPFIARSTVVEYLPMTFSPKEVEALVKCLSDPSPLVRYNALLKFESLPIQERQSIAMKHLEDENRMVRMGASRLILETRIEEYSPADRNKVREARKQYEEMLKHNADFPLGRLQLGDFYIRQNDIGKAIENYEIALEMDSALSLVHSNLATAYNIAGNNQKALETLSKLIKLEPEYSRAYYLRALLYYEMGMKEKSLEDLSSALQLDPDNQDYQRNYANILKAG